MTPENTIVRKNGGRRCRICKNAQEQARYWAKAEAEGRERQRVFVQTPETVYAQLVYDEHGCRMWTGYLNEHGYGRVKVHQKSWLVHRLIWEWEVGPIFPGWTIDHECHNRDADCLGGRTCRHRACTEMSHLREVPSAVNTLAGKGTSAVHARKTHCSNGHGFTKENTLMWGPEKRWRLCVECYGPDPAFARNFRG